MGDPANDGGRVEVAVYQRLGMDLRRRLLDEVEYQFSRPRIQATEQTEIEIHSHKSFKDVMDDDGWVPIFAIANDERVRGYTLDVELLKDVLRSSSLVEVDEESERARSAQQKHMLILREIPENTSVESIRALFEDECPQFSSCEYAGNNSWYIIYTSKDDAEAALLYLSVAKKTFMDNPIQVRMKSGIRYSSTITGPLNAPNWQSSAQAPVVPSSPPAVRSPSVFVAPQPVAQYRAIGGQLAAFDGAPLQVLPRGASCPVTPHDVMVAPRLVAQYGMAGGQPTAVVQKPPQAPSPDSRTATNVQSSGVLAASQPVASYDVTGGYPSAAIVAAPAMPVTVQPPGVFVASQPVAPYSVASRHPTAMRCHLTRTQSLHGHVVQPQRVYVIPPTWSQTNNTTHPVGNQPFTQPVLQNWMPANCIPIYSGRGTFMNSKHLSGDITLGRNFQPDDHRAVLYSGNSQTINPHIYIPAVKHVQLQVYSSNIYANQRLPNHQNESGVNAGIAVQHRRYNHQGVQPDHYRRNGTSRLHPGGEVSYTISASCATDAHVAPHYVRSGDTVTMNEARIVPRQGHGAFQAADSTPASSSSRDMDKTGRNISHVSQAVLSESGPVTHRQQRQGAQQRVFRRHNSSQSSSARSSTLVTPTDSLQVTETFSLENTSFPPLPSNAATSPIASFAWVAKSKKPQHPEESRKNPKSAQSTAVNAHSPSRSIAEGQSMQADTKERPSTTNETIGGMSMPDSSRSSAKSNASKKVKNNKKHRRP